MHLTRDALLSAKNTCPSETVNVPELGGSVIVRGLMAGELTSFQKAVQKLDPKKANGKSEPSEPLEVAIDEDTFAAKLLVRCLVSEKGERLLQDDEWGLTQQWPGIAFQRLAAVALRLSGYVGSAEGNGSSPTPAGASSSA